ncbi:succinate dehydrogenase assembly factor 2, mitochondrial-like [Chrysemys picta bellii]|uniref:succinate dehydrogenase assembly factor 2, mitochondrial-like n=1 Tax=Chrysemys picta bellii TaxID=8478 RepID=UPI001C686785|nr:succinate dehydrogenase assembly factor 2, mitochondrial-like [Chrysemys picta bellii]
MATAMGLWFLSLFRRALCAPRLTSLPARCGYRGELPGQLAEGPAGDPLAPLAGAPQRAPAGQKSLFESRKRGMLENCLLLSLFAKENLNSMIERQLNLYDCLINEPSNDWDIYYWATKAKPTPEVFGNGVMVSILVREK